MKGENMACGDCGMLVDPPMAFHPWIYCQLFKAGITNPAGWLEGQHFIPDPDHWGEDAPEKQRESAALRRRLTDAPRSVTMAQWRVRP